MGLVCDHVGAQESMRGIQKWIEVYCTCSKVGNGSGGYFRNRMLTQWCIDHHVDHFFTIQYDIRSNRIVERCNRSIIELLRKELCENPRVLLQIVALRVV